MSSLGFKSQNTHCKPVGPARPITLAVILKNYSREIYSFDLFLPLHFPILFACTVFQRIVLEKHKTTLNVDVGRD